jgi:hypothetical protein
MRYDVPSEACSMETLVSKWQETREHVSTQRDALVTRARDAGESLVAETRGAGRELAGFVGRESKRWRRYIELRVNAWEHDVRSSLDVRALERGVLIRIDQGLRALDARVRDRLAHIGGGTARAPTKRGRGRKATRPRTRRMAA